MKTKSYKKNMQFYTARFKKFLNKTNILYFVIILIALILITYYAGVFLYKRNLQITVYNTCGSETLTEIKPCTLSSVYPEIHSNWFCRFIGGYPKEVKYDMKKYNWQACLNEKLTD